ncbi:unnamed protein product [Adineta ricciae]|uniref:Uncharacterized protein n=1 Tax=Adineta ricciae TaxID=249248 RepID=A0A814PCK9_ADIRI|nr:unnamed protein product [Adineta ricciae]CAF1352505.1 unnamed protein product [Adineta ricciae]
MSIQSVSHDNLSNSSAFGDFTDVIGELTPEQQAENQRRRRKRIICLTLIVFTIVLVTITPVIYICLVNPTSTTLVSLATTPVTPAMRNLNHCTATSKNVVYYNSSAQLTTMLTADVNEDHKVDIIAGNSIGKGNLLIFFNVDDNQFTKPTIYHTDIQPMFITIGDLNYDDRFDIVLTNNQSKSVQIFFNMGYGKFDKQSIISTSITIDGITIVDVNLDKKLDIVITNKRTNSVVMIINDDDNMFRHQITYSIGLNTELLSIVDIDHDGMIDFLLREQIDNVSHVFVRFNAANGTFINQTTYIQNDNIQSLRTVDMNADDQIDLVSTERSPEINVYMNSGNGSFNQPIKLSTTSTENTLSIADINKDKKLDLILSSQITNQISIHMNEINGTFVKQMTIPVTFHPLCTTSIDGNNHNQTGLIVLGDQTIELLSINCI